MNKLYIKKHSAHSARSIVSSIAYTLSKWWHQHQPLLRIVMVIVEYCITSSYCLHPLKFLADHNRRMPYSRACAQNPYKNRNQKHETIRTTQAAAGSYGMPANCLLVSKQIGLFDIFCRICLRQIVPSECHKVGRRIKKDVLLVRLAALVCKPLSKWWRCP